MGGHGGLNILPQKRWNVYNQDNREKVERDIKKHEEKERQERIRQEQDQADVKYEILKARKQQRARQENGDDEEKPKSFLNEELKTLMPEHFNLFKREEDAHVKEMRQQKNEDYEREKKMKEDRFVEQTTCYLGQTAKKSVPWYCQTAPTEESIEKQKSENENRWGRPRGRDRDRNDRRQKGNNQQQQPSSVFKVPEDNYFQVLDLDSMKDKKVISKPEVKEEKNKNIKEREDSVEKDRKAREKSRDKEKKRKDKKDKKEKKDKKDKKHKKHKKQKSERKMSAESSASRSRSRSKSQENDKNKNKEEERLKQEKLAKLRAERLKREQAEKKKAEKLIKETFPLGKNSDVDSFYYFN